MNEPHTKREPLFKNKDWPQLLKDPRYKRRDFIYGAGAMMDFYEAKITSGELMVVKTVTHDERDSLIYCSGCDWSAPWEVESLSPNMNFCPGCGAKIIE